jgi:hypothetical protein
MVKLCNPFFWEDLTVIFRTGLFLKTDSCNECVSDLVNQILLLYTIGFLVGYVLFVASKLRSVLFAPVLLVTLISIPTLFRLTTAGDPTCGGRRGREAFQAAVPATVQPVASVEASWPPGATVPTARNPFMNITVDEYYYNPLRPAAASVGDTAVKADLDSFFKTEFTRDPTDVFGRSQSQRQFVTMPATTVPNDVGSLQDWLYKLPGKTCKEGGREACFPGTDGATVPWLSSAV